MANNIKEIGEIVKKCKILLLDIEGTTTSISFVKDKLFPYAKENVKQFLDSQWETDAVKEAVAALRQLALDDKEKSVDGLVPIPGEDASKEDQIEGLVNNVKWQMSSDRKAGALKQLQGLIWQQGYDSGDIKGHVYDDVSAALDQWRSVDGQKVYIYSSGSVQAQKLLFAQSLAGDLLRYIDGHFDTAVGSKQEAASYSAIIEKIGVKPEDVLFLTDIPKEGEAARAAGLHVALVSREGNAPLPSEASEAFAVLHSLAQLTVSNKRKTEPQDEQPAKVPKTDTSDDVKTVAEPIALDDSVKTSQDEPARMEVEEPSVQATTEKDTQNVESAATVETIIEDITDSVETVDVPMVDVEPIVTEAEENKSDASKNVEPEKIIVEAKVKELTEMAKPDVNPDGGETHKGVVKIPVEVVTNPDEIVAQSDQIVSKADELVESSKAKDSSEEVPTENSSSKITEELKVQSVEATEPQVNLDSDSPCATITEIEEIATDNLGDVAEIIEDLKPIVEEPANEEMEDLQNVGEVLEKECDEILSKVQDVTNLDNIPLKPLLNPIAEETMETELDAENMDSNDIVDRILDTELELEMKQCNDIDLNTVSEITDDTKTEITEDIKMTCDKKIELESNAKLAEKVLENNKQSTPESMDSESSRPEATVENKASHDKSENNEKIESSNIIENSDKVAIDDKMEGNDKKESIEKSECTKQTESNEKIVNNDEIENIAKVEKDSNEDKVEKKLEISDNASQAVNAAQDQTESNDKTKEANDVKTEVKKDVLPENSKDEDKKQAKSTDTDINTDSKSETEKESQINGKTINGDTETVNINGDASKVEELNSRLSVENGKKTLNGSNGDSVDSEKGQGDKVEAEVAEIKVKTVATEEPRTDPIEQPTEA